MSGEVAQGDIWSATKFITPKGLENSAAKVFPEDTVLVAMYGATAGQVGLLRFAAATNQAVCGILPNGKFLPRFLYYFFLCRKDALVAQAIGNAQPNISQVKIRNMKVPLVPLAEQRRIVGILDKAFAAIDIAKANTEKNLQNTHDMFIAALRDIFVRPRPDWNDNAIGELAEHSLGKMLDKAKNKGTPQPYLRNLNVRWFGFDLSDLLEMRFLPEEKSKYSASKGDVVVCEGGYPGRAAIWEENSPVFFQKALHRVRFHEPTHSKWFVYFLYFMSETGHLRQHFSGTGIQHFTGEALDRLRLPIPPLCELRSHIAQMEKLQQSAGQVSLIHRRKTTALGQLKTSLLHQAFSGAL